MSYTDLVRFIEDAFIKRFGEDIIGVTSQAMIPHEACIQIKVVRFTTEMKDFARTIVEEFDELGRRVSIDVVRQ